jgi:hypothetical protein
MKTVVATFAALLVTGAREALRLLEDGRALILR